MTRITTSLTDAFDQIWGRFLGRLEGLADEEYFWEPVSGCWSVRRDEGGRWRIDGEGGGGPAPDPVPFTTIAWRIGHIGATFVGFGDRLFADGTVTLDDLRFAGSATAAVTFLQDTYHGYWRDRISTITEERWWRPIGPAFGPYAEQSTVDLALHVLDELTHHAAEVGVIRDLYPHKDELSRP